MPPKKKLANDVKAKDLPLERLAEIIIKQDINLMDTHSDLLSGVVGSRGQAIDRSNEFYEYVGDLVTMGEQNHEGLAVNGFIKGSVARSTSPMHLCVLAALHNRKNAFTLLIDTFGKDIGSLLDGGYKANILHHIFAPCSLAGKDMIDKVFDCLKSSLEKPAILSLLNAKDKDGQTVGQYAANRDAQMAQETGGYVNTYSMIYLNHKVKFISKAAHPVNPSIKQEEEDDDVTVLAVVEPPKKKYLADCKCGLFFQDKGKSKVRETSESMGHAAYAADVEEDDGYSTTSMAGASSSSSATKTHHTPRGPGQG